MSRFRVVITDFDYGDMAIERSILEPIGAEVVALQAKSEDDLAEVAPDCDAMINQYARIGAPTIALMQRCRVIARYGVGVDIVDVEAATAKGILVTNVRDYCTEEVADHAIALWLTLARKIVRLRPGHASKHLALAIGPAHPSSARAHGGHRILRQDRSGNRRCAPEAFGVELLVYDPFITHESVAAHGAGSVDKDELLARSDVVFMQVPMTAETRHFLGATEFAAMKPGAIVVNTGRGPTVDNRALYDAIVDGQGSPAPGSTTLKRSRPSARPGALPTIRCSRFPT